MKECKNKCHLLCCDDERYKFGKSPGRCKTVTKMCLVCEYWTSIEDNKCFCCGNKFRHRRVKHRYNILEELALIAKYHYNELFNFNTAEEIITTTGKQEEIQLIKQISR